MLFKNTCFEPNLPKIRFSNNSPEILNLQTHFAYNLRNFQTWLAKPKSQTITCTEFSKE